MFVTFAFTFAVFHFLPALPNKADKVSLSSGALLLFCSNAYDKWSDLVILEEFKGLFGPFAFQYVGYFRVKS